ncbi:MAG: hypothetical protein U5K37_05180 [Natrialbaceae archaeon]|nr:hypothetical protein [Natrialbaceae archaeon]
MTAPLDGNFSTNDLLLEHTIETVDGVMTLEERDGTVRGDAPDAHQRHRRPECLADIVALHHRRRGGMRQSIPTTAISDTVLNASATARSDRSADTTLTVETLAGLAGPPSSARSVRWPANESDVSRRPTPARSVSRRPVRSPAL